MVAKRVDVTIVTRPTVLEVLLCQALYHRDPPPVLVQTKDKNMNHRTTFFVPFVRYWQHLIQTNADG